MCYFGAHETAAVHTTTYYFAKHNLFLTPTVPVKRGLKGTDIIPKL